MKLFNSKKKLVAGAVALVATAGLATGAFAYFTNSGSGSGSASVGTSSAITLSGSAATAVTPDGATSDVAILVTNPGSGSQNVGAVHLVSIAPDASHSACDTTVPTAFSMADTAPVGLLAAGGSTTVHSTLVMHDTGVSQDNCQGASLTLTFSSN